MGWKIGICIAFLAFNATIMIPNLDLFIEFHREFALLALPFKSLPTVPYVESKFGESFTTSDTLTSPSGNYFVRLHGSDCTLRLVDTETATIKRLRKLHDGRCTELEWLDKKVLDVYDGKQYIKHQFRSDDNVSFRMLLTNAGQLQIVDEQKKVHAVLLEPYETMLEKFAVKI